MLRALLRWYLVLLPLTSLFLLLLLLLLSLVLLFHFLYFLLFLHSGSFILFTPLTLSRLDPLLLSSSIQN